MSKSKIKTTSNPFVSIIIPVYNGEDYVEIALNSAFNQTYNNIEIIVVNDGSTDSTDDILQQYCDKIIYIKKENGGVSSALNAGIKKAKGDFISWLSHDDVYFPNKVEKQISFLQTLPSQNRFNTILYSNYSVIDENSKKIGDTYFEKKYFIERLNSPYFPLFNGAIHGCSLLIPRKCFEDIGYFDVKLKATQDYMLWYKMFPKYTLRFLPDRLIQSRSHPKQDSKKTPTKAECDTLWIHMIDNIPTIQINTYFGGLLPFYKNTLDIVSGAEYLGATQYLKEKIHQFKTRPIGKILVSVIIPFRNRIGKTLEAIKSVQIQSHTNLEILLVNDDSKENISPIEEIIVKDARIQLINNNSNTGPAASRNTGIDRAKGEYIAFLDSDDIFLPDKIKKQLEYMLSEETMISHTSYQLFSDSSSEKKNVFSGNKDYTFPKIISKCEIATPTVMAHRDVFFDKKNRFPTDISIGEDICLWIRLTQQYIIVGFDTFLTNVRMHKQQSAYNSKRLILGLRNIFDFAVENFLNEQTILQISILHESLNGIVSKAYSLKRKDTLPNPSDIQPKGTKFLLISASKKISRKIALLSPNYRKMKRLETLMVQQAERQDRIIDKSIDLKNTYVKNKLEFNKKFSDVNEKMLLNQRLRRKITELRRKILPPQFKGNWNLLGEEIKIPKKHSSVTINYYDTHAQFVNKMNKYILQTDVVLDIGCGIHPQTLFEPRVHICIESNTEYREILKAFFPNKCNFIFIKNTNTEMFDDNSADTVFILNHLEHIEKKDGLALLDEADRVARKQVIVFTPLGSSPKHHKNSKSTNMRILSGNKIHEHKSSWSPEDFDDSWDFHICHNCHDTFLESEENKGVKYSGFFAIKTKQFNGFIKKPKTPKFIVDLYNERNKL